MKKYIIDEKQLLELIAGYEEMAFMEEYGVDNWSSVNIDDDAWEETLGDFETFHDLAEDKLKDYQEYKDETL